MAPIHGKSVQVRKIFDSSKPMNANLAFMSLAARIAKIERSIDSDAGKT